MQSTLSKKGTKIEKKNLHTPSQIIIKLTIFFKLLIVTVTFLNYKKIDNALQGY
jgi:hypothetical protein